MNGSAFHFNGLTPEVILDALESIGIYPESGLLPLNSYENRVYQFRADDGQRYVAKFYRPERWSDEQILEEHQFAAELQQAEIPLAAPIVRDGVSLHHLAEHRFALFPSMGGRSMEPDNLDQLEAIGQFIGRMHQYAKGSRFQQRQSLTPQTFGLTALDELAQCALIPEPLRDSLQQSAMALQQQIQQQWQASTAHIMRLHGDLHPGNILWTPDGPGFVDLDDACNGPAIQDLWMMLSGDRAQQQLQLEVLLTGYEEFCDFATRELALIEALRGLRLLHYNGWLARRWADPAFPQHFPWFATASYWQQQQQLFDEQLQRMAQAPLSLIPY